MHVNQGKKTIAIREYNIGNIKYIVKATVRDGVTEDASTKIRRLIRNDMGKNDIKKNDK